MEIIIKQNRIKKKENKKMASNSITKRLMCDEPEHTRMCVYNIYVV